MVLALPGRRAFIDGVLIQPRALGLKVNSPSQFRHRYKDYTLKGRPKADSADRLIAFAEALAQVDQ